MAVKKRGLSRGLDALLGAGKAVVAASDRPQADTKTAQNQLTTLPVDRLCRGKYQPRQDMHAESLNDLADSIRAQGVVQPIVVRPLGNNQYEIIAGERRWRAAQIAELQDVPVVIRDVPDEAAIAMALIENIQRENLNPLEEATALQRLLDEFDMTHQQAAEAVGRSRAAVSNLLRLQELKDDVKRLLRDGKLEMGHARALLGLSGGQQSEAAHTVVKRGLTVRETERLVQSLNKSALSTPKDHRLDPDIRRFQEELSDRLGAKVDIQHSGKGKGKLTIHYNNLDELDGILKHIK